MRIESVRFKRQYFEQPVWEQAPDILLLQLEKRPARPFFLRCAAEGFAQELMMPRAIAMHTSSGNEPAPIFDMIRER